MQRFQNRSDPLRFFVGQPKTGGYGITLTAANTVIYYSNFTTWRYGYSLRTAPHRSGKQGHLY